MLGRRSFFIACGRIVAMGAFAKACLVSANDRPQTMSPADPLPSQAPAVEPQPAGPVLRIEGWDVPAAGGPAAANEVWIRINSSWRAAWR